MKRKNLMVVMMLVAVLTVIPGCGTSDAETEKKLEGTWTYSTTEVENGIKMTMTAIEKYSLPDHRFEATMTLEVGYPVNETMATIKYSGKWSASKEGIVNKVDKSSITFEFNKSLVDRSDRQDFKEEMLAELKMNEYEERVRIVSPIGDTFEAVDDEGEKYTYVRLSYGGNNGASTSGEIPNDREVVSGDFDGDGKIDHIWIEGEFDDDDFATTPLRLSSDNPKLDGLSWNAPCGVMLFNLGLLDDSKKDFLGSIPFAMSNWAQYEVYRYNGSSWKEALKPFSVYLDSDVSKRVTRSKKPGFVTIFENDPESDDIFDVSSREMPLKE